jgi:hypothetical protein
MTTIEPHYADSCVTDTQLDEAAEVIERHIRDGLATGRLRDSTVYAADAVRELWGLGYAES